MEENDALRPEWLAFERDLGFRPKLRGPTYDDTVRQDTDNGDRLLAKFSSPDPDNISLETAWHQTPAGLRLKSYRPPAVRAAGLKKPLVYFIHGGGFVIGSVDEDDRFVNRHTKDTGYPAALEDCVEGAKWCIANAKMLGGKPGPIVVMGKSAGGSLAFGVALKLIDEGLAANVRGVVVCQPLTIHPDAVEDMHKHRYRAFDESAENTVNTKDAMLAFYDLCGAPLDCPYTWPFLHDNIDELPMVHMNSCGADTLRDDARMMQDLLNLCKIPNECHEYERLPHYFFAFPSDLEDLRNEYFDRTARGIKWIIQ